MKNLLASWKQDLPAGVVVFLVAVPLCLGIALASEAPVFSGLIAGICGGIVVGLISNSSIGVSGPAAGLTAIVASSIHQLGTFELFLAAAVIAGIIQFVLGLLRLGIISLLFPNILIKGMLTAIGLLIIFKQFPHAIGYDKDFEGDEEFFQVDGENTFSEIVHSLNYITPSALIITLVSIALLLVWERKFIQQSFLRFIPGPLVVVLLGIGFTKLFMGTSFALIPEHRVDLGITGKPIRELFTYPDFSQLGSYKIYVIALTLALVGSIETLLSVDAADKLDPKKRTTNTNRELMAQGIGNLTSGLLGGLPLTQVVVRTSANVNAGGTTKMATIIHGILIAISVLTIPQFFNYVPYAALAAILIMVGYKLAKPTLFIEVFKENKVAFFLFVITVLAILFSDLLKGMIVGWLLAFIIVLIGNKKRLGKIWQKKAITIVSDKKQVEIHFIGHVSFINKLKLHRILKQVEPNQKILLNFEGVIRTSSDIEEIINRFKTQVTPENLEVIDKK